jgi:hypothetical protein
MLYLEKKEREKMELLRPMYTEVPTIPVLSICYLPEFVLRMFENRVLRRIFGSKRDEVTGSW